MTIAEPMTMLTDFLLAAACGGFSFALMRRAHGLRAIRLWALAFAAMGLAALAGGIYHGFQMHLDRVVLTILWKITVYAIGAGGFCMLAASILVSLRQPLQRWALGAALLKLTVYAVWMLNHDEFRYVIYDYAPSLFGVLILHMLMLPKHAPGAGWIISGALMTYAAAAIQLLGVGWSESFNHNDLYHVVQLVAFSALYLGARSAGEGPGAVVDEDSTRSINRPGGRP